MSSIKCTLTLNQLLQLRQLRDTQLQKDKPDNVVKWKEIFLAQLPADVRQQFKDQFELSAEQGKELNEMMNRLVNSKTKSLSIFSQAEQVKFFDLLERAQETLGASNLKLNNLKAYIQQKNLNKDIPTKSAIEALENMRATAVRNGDQKQVDRVDKAIEALQRSVSATENLRIDINAMQKVLEQRRELMEQKFILETLQDIGNGEIADKVKKEQQKLADIQAKILNLNRLKRDLKESGLTDDEADAELEELDKQISELIAQREKIQAKIQKGLSKKTKDLIAQIASDILVIDSKIRQLDLQHSDLDYAQAITIQRPDDSSSYLTSARDYFQKTQQVKDEIKLVEEVVSKKPEGENWTKAELERLLGVDISRDTIILTAMRNLFTKVERDPETKAAIVKDVESISQEEAESLIDLWKENKKEDVYDPKISIEEARKLADIIRSTERQSIVDVDPDAPQITTRTRAEALTAKPGYQYDTNKEEDRIKLATDLQQALGRLNTLSNMTRFGGLIPEWALVSALGNDGQSLFTLFDGALVTPQSIEYAQARDPLHLADDHQRRQLLQTILINNGMSPETINQLPEFSSDFKSDLTSLSGVFFIRNADGQVTGVQISVKEQQAKGMETSTRQLIVSSDGAGKPLTREDAIAVLNELEELQNSGYKVTSHGALVQDGAIEALAVQSKDAKLALRVGIRMYDTALMAFKNTLGNNYNPSVLPSLESLSTALNVSTTALPSTSQAQQLLETENLTDVTQIAQAHSVAMQETMFIFNARAGTQATLVDSKGQSTTLHLQPVSTLWFDGNGSGLDYSLNSKYLGVNHLLTATVFSNLAITQGFSANREITYDLAKVQSIATNLLILAIQEVDPNQLNNVLDGLVGMPSDMDKHYDLVMQLSSLNHQAYMPLKKEMWEQNDRKFIIAESQDSEGKIAQETSISAVEYTDRAISEMLETLRSYFRKPEFALRDLAVLLGFREQQENESTSSYAKAIFRQANLEFNGVELNFVDFGNANFDYISAVQLGRGFAQVMLGFIREGNTLTQNIDTPLDAAQQIKENLEAENTTLDVTDVNSEIKKRTFLPLTRRSVSYFAPLSMYEQERVFSDWALRKRYQHILNRTLTDEDRKGFKDFVRNNKMVELRNKLQQAKDRIYVLKRELKLDPSKKAAQTELEVATQEFTEAKTALKEYLAAQDNQRLEQGRVQTYRLINPINNRSLFTRIPTIDESIDMSLEVAMEIPQLVATLVHDSRNYLDGSEMHLNESYYMTDAGKSGGGPGARATLKGIHSLVGFLAMYPQKFRMSDQDFTTQINQVTNNPNLTPEQKTAVIKQLNSLKQSRDNNGFVNITADILIGALNEGHKARQQGAKYSKSTYFDDKFSGIHHLVAAMEAYMPKSRGKSLLEELVTIQQEILTTEAKNLTDYYSKTLDFTINNIAQLKEQLRRAGRGDAVRMRDLDIVQAILTADQTGGHGEGRDFFKGVVIPIIYSGGKAAVISDLKKRRADATKSGDPNNPLIGDLTDAQLEVLADALTAGAGQTMGRIIDDIMDMDPDYAPKLASALVGDTEKFTKGNFLLPISEVMRAMPEAIEAREGIQVLEQLIDARIRYVAELTIKPSEIAQLTEASGTQPRLSREAARKKLADAQYKVIKDKWQSRIDQAIQHLKDSNIKNGQKESAGFDPESELGIEIQTILAGGKGQYQTQASLLFLNKVMASGYELVANADTVLEAEIKNGRYIAPDDLMFQNYTVFHTAAFGTSTGRMQYPGNYLTNPQGSSLSKGLRKVYKEDGSIDWKESVLLSMWKLTNNPFENKTPADARKLAEDLAIKNYALMLSTDYSPEFMGYDRNTAEDRTEFFKEWNERSELERIETLRLQKGSSKREALKTRYREIQISEGIDPGNVKELTDDQIDSAVESNSVPFSMREGIRILAPEAISEDSEALMTAKDAKGLAAFVPRIADSDVRDQIVHGLYTIHHGLKRMRTKGGAALININKAKEGQNTLASALSQKPEGSSIYDASSSPFIPVSGNSLPELMMDHEPAMLQKAAVLKNNLDTYAFEHGYGRLVDDKDYPRLYQMYKIHRELIKLAHEVSRLEKQAGKEREFRMAHRNFTMRLFELTKFQRDAKGSERSILDFKTSIGIDPTKFKYENGTNMNYLDVLKVLARLGVQELKTIEYGIHPRELMVAGSEMVDVLKDAETITKPYFVQGHDVTLLIMEFLAHDSIQREATRLVQEEINKGNLPGFKIDGKFVNLSDVPADIANRVIENILENDALRDAAINELNLYITLDWAGTRGQVKVTPHAQSNTAFVIQNQGIGSPVVNYVRTGPTQAQFMLTAEAAKRILSGARNSGFFSRLETAVQTNKFIGTQTNVGRLRTEAFKDIGDRKTQQVAEEVELLSHLMGPDQDLRLLVTSGQSELRDEFGFVLNPYDAEFYFYDRGIDTITGDAKEHYLNMTPFEAALTAPIHSAIAKGANYITIADEVKELKDFLNKTSKERTPVSYYIFLKYSAMPLDRSQYKTLIEEMLGVVSLTDQEFSDIETKAEKLISHMDKINFAPTKGKNPYLSLAMDALQETRDSLAGSYLDIEEKDIVNAARNLPDIPDTSYKVREGRVFKVIRNKPAEATTSKDMELKILAVREAKQLINDAVMNDVELVAHVNEMQLSALSFDPSEFNTVMASSDGARVVGEIDNLVRNNVISEDTAVFYRYLVLKIAKSNPNLLPLLSITSSDTDSLDAGYATNDSNKFRINLNSTVLKKMGTIDQVRVFAHELAHIARLAFIRDNSKEYHRMLGLFRSKKGREAVRTMLLAMNNNQKYEGIESDIQYYLDNPEEFIAAWGGWLLVQNTFTNPALMKQLQGRNTIAFKTTKNFAHAFYAVEREVMGIAIGLRQLDEGLRNEIFGTVENMFGFTSAVEREIITTNKVQTLFRIENIADPLNATEVAELDTLGALPTRSPAQNARYDELLTRHSSNPLRRGNRQEIDVARNNRIAAGSDFDATQLNTVQQAEVVESLVVSVLNQTHTNARANHTFGGLARNVAEKYFSVERVNQIMRARHFLILGVASQHTYDNSNPIISALMHITSDTMGMYAYQFETLDGANGLRESRFSTKRMTERLTYEREELWFVVKSSNPAGGKKAEFQRASTEAVRQALGLPTTATFDPKVQTQINNLATALKENVKEFKEFLFSDYASKLEDLPTMLDTAQLGLRNRKGSVETTKQQTKNRQLLEDELTNMIRDRILNGEGIDSNVIYVMNILPREVNQDTLVDFRLNNTDVYRALLPSVLARIAELKNWDATNPATISNLAGQLSRAANNNFVPASGTDLTQELILEAFTSTINNVLASASVGSLGRWGPALDAAITNRAINQISQPVTAIDGLKAPNEFSSAASKAVMKIHSSSLFSEKELSGDPSRVLARLLLGHLGNRPKFLNKNAFMTQELMLQNSAISEFFSSDMHIALLEFERTEGYSKLSERAIEKMTGIKNVNITQLISMIENTVQHLQIPVEDIPGFLKSLNIIKQKLQVDRGLALGSTEHRPSFELMAKYGPDVVRMVHGSNLNTASIMVEGTMGMVITTLFGGNPFKFLGTVLGTFFPSYFGKNMTEIRQKGAAVNMLMGLERMVQDQRESAYLTDTAFDRNAGRVEKLRRWLRQSNNRGMTSIQTGLTEQAQWIFKKNLDAGNIDKLVNIVNTKKPKNLTDLAKYMAEAGIKGYSLNPMATTLNPYMAFIFMQSGMLKPGVLKAYRDMSLSIHSQNTGKWGLDLQAAGRFIDDAPKQRGYITINGNKHLVSDAKRAIQAVYYINREFTNIVAVDTNPFDTAVSTDSFALLYNFYKQYPNLFTSQKVFRLAGRLDKRTFAGLLISNMVMDVLYNLLLQVATGMLPLTALFPWHEDWIGRHKPWEVVKTIVTRNPVFSPTLNLFSTATFAAIEEAEKVKENKYQNAYNKKEAGVKKFAETLLKPTLIPVEAAMTLLKGTLPSVLEGTHTIYDTLAYGQRRGRLNDQEYWDIMDNSIRVGLRMFPGVELPIRAAGPAIIESVFGARPVRLPMRPINAPVFSAPGQPLNRFQQKSSVSSGERAREFTRQQERNRATNPAPAPKFFDR